MLLLIVALPLLMQVRAEYNIIIIIRRRQSKRIIISKVLLTTF